LVTLQIEPLFFQPFNNNMVKFLITGFGEFAGVTKNPTTQLVQELPQTLALNPLQLMPSSIRYDVIRVSAVDSLIYLSDLLMSSDDDSVTPMPPHGAVDDEPLVLLHFGVGTASQNAFRLERCAWNEATFRVPGL
jgi:hypothetical protein